MGLPPRRIRDIFEVGKTLSRLITEKAAINATESQLEALGQTVLGGEAAVDDKDAFLATQVRFNTILLEAADVPLASEFIGQLGDYLDEFQNRSLACAKNRSAAANEHRCIWEALIRRDVGAAAEASDQHADNANDRIRVAMSRPLAGSQPEQGVDS